MPRGKLRESKKGAKRANCIVVTKCPEGISGEEKDRIEKLVKPKEYQQLYFSLIIYSDKIYSLNTSKNLTQLKDKKVNLVTGVVNPKGLLSHLKDLGLIVNHFNYPDHYNYLNSDVQKFGDQIVITTEKDFTKLRNMDIENLFYLPIEFKIHNQEDLLAEIANKIAY